MKDWIEENWVDTQMKQYTPSIPEITLADLAFEQLEIAQSKLRNLEQILKALRSVEESKNG